MRLSNASRVFFSSSESLSNFIITIWYWFARLAKRLQEGGNYANDDTSKPVNCLSNNIIFSLTVHIWNLTDDEKLVCATQQNGHVIDRNFELLHTQDKNYIQPLATIYLRSKTARKKYCHNNSCVLSINLLINCPCNERIL